MHIVGRGAGGSQGAGKADREHQESRLDQPTRSKAGASKPPGSPGDHKTRNRQAGPRMLGTNLLDNRDWSAWLPRLKTTFLHLFVIYASVPFLIRLFPVLLTKCVFLNMFKIPFFVDLSRPELLLNHTVNVYLTTEPEVTIGVWHSVPASRGIEAQGKDHSWYEEALGDDNPVILYLHGNGATRAANHRVNLIKVMSAIGFHVLAVDYRGYGDSSGSPSEGGFTTDILYLYDWVKARSGKSRVFLWGHSLGTGIATNVARKLLEDRGTQVDGLILESPYTNIRDAAANIPVTKIYRQFPGFDYLVLDTLALADLFFQSDENVKVLTSPILILHAEDDPIIPSHLGRKLFEIAISAYQDKNKVRFVAFPDKLGLAHDYISFHPDLPTVVKDFLKNIT
ncbi:protein ABHD12B isoform X1 [Alligator sinensis]|uniref:Protein ABHD12B isoform X1 n=1 Tax=Alligator sinensis TaxID=38654 RepID=A0A1U7S277_ALLSI|nr:protein ABHD12B isoform X1 [Alligator sinensis]